MKEETTGITHDYTKRGGVDFSEIITPKDSPAWAKDPNQLWNNADKAEKRKNSTVGREFLISLPHELTQEQRRDLARNLSQNLVDKFGFAIQYSIHKPEEDQDKRNHHVHILASTRKLESTGFTSKTRELDDRYSNTIPEVREMVSNTINQHLEKAGLDVRVDHRSLLDQQAAAANKGDIKQFAEVNRQPTIKVGHGSGSEHRAMVNDGIKSSNTKANAEFKNGSVLDTDNKKQNLQQPLPDAQGASDGPDIDSQLADLDHQIGELESKIAAATMQTGKSSRLRVMKLNSLKEKLEAQARNLRFKKVEKKSLGNSQDQQSQQTNGNQHNESEKQQKKEQDDFIKRDKQKAANELRNKAREFENQAMKAPPQEKMALWSKAFELQKEADILELENIREVSPNTAPRMKL